MDFTIRPMTQAEHNYCYSWNSHLMATIGCIGHLCGDMGREGNGFYTTWFDHQEDLKTQAFKDELDTVVNALRSDPAYGGALASRGKLAAYCYAHPDGRITPDRNAYGFRLNTENYVYMLRLCSDWGDYNFYIYCYVRESLDCHMAEAGRGIRFVDSHYRETNTRDLDETQNRTHRILRVAAEDVSFLRDLQVGLSTLRAFQKHSQENLKDRQELFLWTAKNKVVRDVSEILEHVTVHKLLRYMDRQYAALRADRGRGRYNNMQYAVSEYRDYLDMCVKLGYDMGNSFVLYPKDLRQAHDKAQGRVKAKADAQMRRDFKAAMKSISGHLDFEDDGMKMVLPANAEDLAAEGNALHHCVGSYANRVARKECVILFLRQTEELDKPFYTVEVRSGKIAQVRGFHNGDPTPEVERFMAKWEQQVLRAA